MKRNRLIAWLAALALLCAMPAAANNPIIRTDDAGNRVYAGDPATLVVGDTVYLYVGHDTSTTNSYKMPEWLCYSSTDLIDWKYEGVPLRAGDFPWGSSNDAWASQVVEYRGKYYFFMCKNSTGISVAVSDSPTGPFVNALGSNKLVYPNETKGIVGWDDIDPTVWIETDENGVEHRYLCWGNRNCYMVELNEDMISRSGSIREVEITGIPEGNQFTEAPWIYKRNGLYYLFFASNWHEELSYATSENIWGPYAYGGIVMPKGSASNTNHPAVLDFKGKTYLVYHTGALEKGSGYRRSVCIDELFFDENGRVIPLEESSIGLDGTAVRLAPLRDTTQWVSHDHFENLGRDDALPTGALLRVGAMTDYPSDFRWEIVPGKTSGNEHYVSIQSVNKMGYYITNAKGQLKLLHDEDGTAATAQSMTFVQSEGLCGSGVSFESLSARGSYLTAVDGRLVLSDGSDAEAASFLMQEEPRLQARLSYEQGKLCLNGRFTPFGNAVMLLVKAPDGSIEHMEKIVAMPSSQLSWSYQPKQSGRYSVLCGRFSDSIDVEEVAE